MKYLVLLLIIGLVLYVMSRKRNPPPPAPPKPGAAPRLEGIVACRHCGLHLPRSEALAGPGGDVYCSASHRDAGPRA